MEVQRESIFISALRGFFKSLFVLLGAILALVIAGFIFAALSSTNLGQEKTQLEFLPDLKWKREVVSLSSPVILQFNVHGIIGNPEELDALVAQNILVDSRTGLLQNNRVKGILLHINTPGGTVTDSDAIYRMLLTYKERFKVPVFGYIEGMCASGGMYIASAADKLFCSPTAVVGSVGVRSGPFFNFSDAIANFGVQAKTLTQGIDKDAMNPFRPWKPNEDQNISDLIAYYYQQFVNIVTSARPNIDKNKLIQEYGAKVFDGVTAQNYGYVDVANSSYFNALASLLKEAGIDEEKPYQVVELKAQHGLLSSLVKGSTLFHGKLEHSLTLGTKTSFTIQEPVAYIYQP